MTSLSSMSDAELADQIVTWAGRIAAGEAELLILVGEFDAREAWGGIGLLSCAHWLSWRTSLSPSASREKVRVARALRELPRVQEAFGAGRLSYSQVRAITRVATPQEQERWVEAARCATGGQLEKLVRGVRRARKVDEDAADPELAAWRTRCTKSYDADGNAVYRLVVPAQESAVVEAALEEMRTRLDRRAADASAEARSPQAEAPAALEPVLGASAEATSPQGATMAEAFVELARTALETRDAGSVRRARSALVAQIDPLTGWGRLRDGELLPPTSLVAALKTLPGRGGAVRLTPLTRHDLRVHDQGRDQRQPSLALRELIGTLDGERCRFPGCTRHRKLHAHHLVYWSAGGSTDLDNLVLLCGRHHTLVHQLGFTLVLHRDRKLTVTTAGGVPVLHHPGNPWRPAAELDPERRVDADTLPPDHVVSRIDIGYAVMVLTRQSA
jgi:hypothetical protein